ncbi:hypothetical protein [Treponema putidum]|uniref:hypothetical protein n=1 Tax=Treponema putidum TaxID=221027 RepID=UPI0005D2075A|nr:hypothetical protein [Treponema putidum]
MINSSAEIQPHCLSAEFCAKHKTSHYCMQFCKAKLREKTFFRKLRLLAKSFYGGIYDFNGKKSCKTVQ